MDSTRRIQIWEFPAGLRYVQGGEGGKLFTFRKKYSFWPQWLSGAHNRPAHCAFKMPGLCIWAWSPCSFCLYV